MISTSNVDADLQAISRIAAVPALLEVVADTTGLRIALIARITDDTWTACAVLDRVGYGLKVGDELQAAITL